MENKMKNLKRYTLLFLSWLILPPIFFFLAKKRGISTKWKRLLLSFISPVSIICVNILLALSVVLYYLKIEPTKYLNKSDIEEQIGFEFPDYEEIRRDSRYYPNSQLNACHTYIDMKFTDNADTTLFYKEIEKQIGNSGSNWNIDDEGEYMYNNSSKNGRFFRLKIISNDSIKLSYGDNDMFRLWF